jgi:copper(I)-binding protein
MEPNDHRKAGAMTRLPMRILILASLAAAIAAPATSADYKVGSLKIQHPWARPAAAGGVAAGYLVINNLGGPDVLTAVETPVAKASLHRSAMTGGMATMRAMGEGLAVPAKQTVVLGPGGDHIMLAGLNHALTAGQKIPAILVFQKAGRVKIEISVETMAPQGQKSANNNQH